MSTGDELLDAIGEIYDRYRYAIGPDDIEAMIAELQAAINKYLVGQPFDQAKLDAHDKEYYSVMVDPVPAGSVSTVIVPMDEDAISYSPSDDNQEWVE